MRKIKYFLNKRYIYTYIYICWQTLNMFRKLYVRKLGAGKYEINFTKSIYIHIGEEYIFARLISSFENVLFRNIVARRFN